MPRACVSSSSAKSAFETAVGCCGLQYEQKLGFVNDTENRQEEIGLSKFPGENTKALGGFRTDRLTPDTGQGVGFLALVCPPGIGTY